MANTQKITRSNLKVIYDSINESCGWRKKIQDLILWSDDSSIIVPEEMVTLGYKEANAEQKKLIEKYFKINIIKKITDRVKDFDDILEISGKTLAEILPYKTAKTKQQRRLNSLAKIQLLEEVLNEGWIADFSNTEYKYYPYFEFKSGGVVLVSDIYCDLSYISLAQAAYFKNSELAVFAGKTFLKEYKDFISYK